MSAPTIKKSTLSPVVLLAGGAGFLGSHIAKSLLSKNAKIVVVDNLVTGSKENLKSLFKNPRFFFIKHDLNEGVPDNIKSVDYILHLAAFETYPFGKEEISLDSLLTNAFATKNLLDLAQKSKAKFLLVSSIEVYQGVLSSLSLEHYFGPTSFDEKRFSQTEAKRFAESLVWKYYKEYSLDARVVRLGEVYGPLMNLEAGGTLGRLTRSLLKGENLLVFGEGLEKEYYTYIKDAVSGVLKALFSEGTRGKIFPLSPLEPVTTLELTYLLKSFADPSTEVVFEPPKKGVVLPELKVIDGQAQKDLSWEIEVELKEGIKKTLDSFGYKKGKLVREIVPPPIQELQEKRKFKLSLPKLKIPHPKIKTLKKISHLKTKIIIFLGSFLIFLWGISFPFLKFSYHAFFAYKNFKSLSGNLKILNLDGALKNTKVISHHQEKGGEMFRSLAPLFSFLKKEKQYKNYLYLLEGGKYETLSLEHGIKGLSPLLENLPFLGKEPPKKGIFLPALSQSFLELEKAQEYLLLAEAEIKRVDFNLLPLKVKDALETNASFLNSAKEGLSAFLKIKPGLPSTLGFFEPQTYLLLLQNSNEIRATGGFIGSYGELKLVDGKIETLKIDDIYNPSGILDKKGVKLEPPPPLKECLGVDRLLLHDANWEVSFPKSAKTISSLYEQAVGVKVAGAFALDLNFIKRILEVVGPIELPLYGEKITAENFFEKIEYQAEAGYFEGSPAKKTFLSNLGEKLFDKLSSLEPEKKLPLILAIKKSLEEKDLLCFLPQENFSRFLAEKGWDGEVKESKGDYLFVVDSNVGGTKANYFVKKTLNYKVQTPTREGNLEGTLTLNYTHTQAANTWPGGPYKNYLRILTPKGSTLLQALEKREGIEEDISALIREGEEGGKTVLAHVFQLNAGKSVTLTLNYKLPEELALYSLLVQKQPGTVQDLFTFTFFTPFGKEVLETPLGFQKIGSTLRWTGNLKKDLLFEIPL